jgi:hypothetical protein
MEDFPSPMEYFPATIARHISEYFVSRENLFWKPSRAFGTCFALSLCGVILTSI